MLFPYTTLFRSVLHGAARRPRVPVLRARVMRQVHAVRSEEHTSELQSPVHLVCRLLLAKKQPTGAAAGASAPGDRRMVSSCSPELDERSPRLGQVWRYRELLRGLVVRNLYFLYQCSRVRLELQLFPTRRSSD